MIKLCCFRSYQIKYIYGVNRLTMKIWSTLVGLNFYGEENQSINYKEQYIVVMNHSSIVDMFLAAVA